MKLASDNTADAVWQLISLGDGNLPTQTPVGTLPFLVGRDHRLSLHIPSPSVSQLHAKIGGKTDELCVKDCASTNGTFVNGSRVERPLKLHLKFDMTLIRDIHQATGKNQEMLELLVQMTKELGTVPLAKGIEREEEAVVCCQLGFELLQGYLFGRPETAATSLTKSE